ncbi:hypothetical protein B0T26DRAFT_751659 [Lasiosphaeria miniovina]|uniref:Uncharacterized protein n=1 Tax=Lasiosphaeria miniovina TaxID=1954250 RepID=A0AA40AKQ3_9PEZI|nr:uncharacterized protein B0T26DRAFT_751659 [Lasiosphaeria miniovina]KAK0717623.1 hypothetical protein B0T26DRAFT_751659 [Lasiosphaeria miniovina]
MQFKTPVAAAQLQPAVARLQYQLDAMTSELREVIVLFYHPVTADIILSDMDHATEHIIGEFQRADAAQRLSREETVNATFAVREAIYQFTRVLEWELGNIDQDGSIDKRGKKANRAIVHLRIMSGFDTRINALEARYPHLILHHRVLLNALVMLWNISAECLASDEAEI